MKKTSFLMIVFSYMVLLYLASCGSQSNFKGSWLFSSIPLGVYNVGFGVDSHGDFNFGYTKSGNVRPVKGNMSENGVVTGSLTMPDGGDATLLGTCTLDIACIGTYKPAKDPNAPGVFTMTLD